jgi:UDP-N-acetylmuramoyl-tripeptide--D-alanyl-D-alanine ligase
LGHIKKHTQILRPYIAIVTVVGSDHYKAFRSLEATAQEKGRLVESLPKRGVAVLNADDPHVRAMAARTRARVLTFGLASNADVRATEVSSVWPDRLSLTIAHDNESLRVHTRLVGEHWTTSVLAAVACGLACGIDLKTCGEVLQRFNPVFGRYSVHARRGSPTYVLDTQKAPLWTIATGLTFVAQARAPRKTIVFGTISDYAGNGSRTYRKIAREALEVADRVVFVGPNASHVSKLCRGNLHERLFAFGSSYEASAFLSKAQRNELVYVKASITDHLERTMLSKFDRVVCWQERCQKFVSCPDCHRYRKPYAPRGCLGTNLLVQQMVGR